MRIVRSGQVYDGEKGSHAGWVGTPDARARTHKGEGVGDGMRRHRASGVALSDLAHSIGRIRGVTLAQEWLGLTQERASYAQEWVVGGEVVHTKTAHPTTPPTRPPPPASPLRAGPRHSRRSPLLLHAAATVLGVQGWLETAKGKSGFDIRE